MRQNSKIVQYFSLFIISKDQDKDRNYNKIHRTKDFVCLFSINDIRSYGQRTVFFIQTKSIQFN